MDFINKITKQDYNDCYLKNEKVNFRIPVVPESFKINAGQENITANLYKYGDTVIDSRPKPKIVSFSSFFTDKNYSFLRNKQLTKNECIENIMLLKNSKQRIQAIIIGTEIGNNNNFYCFIDDFSYSTRPDGDIDFSITLREARII